MWLSALVAYLFLHEAAYLVTCSGTRNARNDHSKKHRTESSLCVACDHMQARLELAIAGLASRKEIVKVAQAENMTTGAELGVQVGEFASWNLQHWPSNQRYYMIDVWAPQENYNDLANVEIDQHNANYERAIAATNAWKSKRDVKRMLTTDAAQQIANESVDFIYVDARHDYCGVKEDLENYWSKVRPGGIMAGHDFYTANEQPDPNQDWSLCLDGSRHEGAVRGAVEEFFRSKNVRVYRTWEETWYSWIVRKPLNICNACAEQRPL